MTVYRMIDPATVTAAEWAEWERRDRAMGLHEPDADTRLKAKLGLERLSNAAVVGLARRLRDERQWQETWSKALASIRTAEAERDASEGFIERATRLMDERGLEQAQALREAARDDPAGYRAYRESTYL